MMSRQVPTIVLSAGLSLLLAAGAFLVAQHRGWISIHQAAAAGGAVRAAPPPGGCPHTLAPEACPYCNPRLIVDLGFCTGHNTPEAFCALCNTGVIPALQAAGDWCAQHGQAGTYCTQCRAAGGLDPTAAQCPHDLAPGNCPFCTPALIVSKGFCAGHGVPEAFCHRCDPTVAVAFKARGDWCDEHDAPETFCPVCSPAFREAEVGEPIDGVMGPAPAEIGIQRDGQLPYAPRPGQVVCDTESMRVRMAPGIGERVGLELTAAESLSLDIERTFNAQLDYNRNRLAELASRAPGVVAEVLKEAGSRVTAGETLAVIDSIEVGNAKAELLQAQALVAVRARDHERERALHERGVSSEAEALAARAALAEARIALSRARQALLSFGFGEAEIDGFVSREDTAARTALLAPFDGVVLERKAAPGEVVGTEKVLFRIADLSVMWAYLDVAESDLAHIREGQPMLFAPDGMAGARFPGRITRVGTEVDPTTRTLRARAELANPDGHLRANLFGKAEVTLRGGERAVVVPKTAVQWEGCCHVVFVRQSDLLYQPRKVQLGHELDNHYEIVGGLAPGERIVTTGSFLLKTEIMKSSIGAGCCEINPGA